MTDGSAPSTTGDVATPDPPAVQPPQTPEDAYAYFRTRRELAVVQPRGSLALVATHLVESEQSIWDLPGRWAPLPEGESGLLLTATGEEGVRLDGELVDGEVVVRGTDHKTPGRLDFGGTRSGSVRASAGRYALQLWDSASEAIRNFGGIAAFPYDPAWVLSARWEENPEGTTFGFERMKDEDGAAFREEIIPGRILLRHDGADYDLVAFKSGRALQLVFADATSGDTTYSACRFLFIAPNANGTITLDFNRAILPPCAFSYAFNCPMPPKQNRFPFPVEAGEKNVLAKNGSLLH